MLIHSHFQEEAKAADTVRTTHLSADAKRRKNRDEVA